MVYREIKIARRVINGGDVRWCVDIPARLAGKRRRVFCRDKSEAEAVARGYSGGNLSNISLGERREFDKLVAEYLAGLAVRSVVYRQGQAQALAKFTAVWGARDIDSIRARDIEEFLARIRLQDGSAPGPTSLHTWFCSLRGFLLWCERREYITVSPTRRMRPPARSSPPKEILTPEQFARALDWARAERVRELARVGRGKTAAVHAADVVLPYLLLGGLAGLRTKELLLLKWDAVNLRDGWIHVGRDVIKKTRGVTERYVRIGARLMDELERIPAGDRVGPVIKRSPAKFRQRRKALARFLGLADWPDNCLRHSFGTYYLAHYRDPGALAVEMGHTSPETARRNYIRPVPPEVAALWWGKEVKRG